MFIGKHNAKWLPIEVVSTCGQTILCTVAPMHIDLNSIREEQLMVKGGRAPKGQAVARWCAISDGVDKQGEALDY